MSKTKFTFFIILTFILSFFISSCGTAGCTDNQAENYDPSAKKHCCCEYKGTVVFWYGKTTSQNLMNYGSTVLTYYVDGKIVGSGAVNIYWNSSPSCGQAASITVEKDLGGVTNKSFSYRIVDQDGDVIWDGYENWTANTCLKDELTF